MEENGPIFGSISDDRPISAAAPLPRPGDTLLDEATSKVRIDQTPLGTIDSLAQSFVADVFTAREPNELFRLEDPHGSFHSEIYRAARYSSRGGEPPLKEQVRFETHRPRSNMFYICSLCTSTEKEEHSGFRQGFLHLTV